MEKIASSEITNNTSGSKQMKEQVDPVLQSQPLDGRQKKGSSSGRQTLSSSICTRHRSTTGLSNLYSHSSTHDPLRPLTKYLSRRAKPFSTLLEIGPDSIWGTISCFIDGNGEDFNLPIVATDVQSLVPHEWYTIKIVDAVLLCLEKELVEHLANPEKNKGHVRKPIAVIPFELLKKVIDHTDGLDCFKNTSMEELKRWINTSFRRLCNILFMPIRLSNKRVVMLVASKSERRVCFYDPKCVAMLLDTENSALGQYIKWTEKCLQAALGDAVGSWSKNAQGSLHAFWPGFNMQKQVKHFVHSRFNGPLCCWFFEYWTKKFEATYPSGKKRLEEGRFDLLRARHLKVLGQYKLSEIVPAPSDNAVQQHSSNCNMNTDSGSLEATGSKTEVSPVPSSELVSTSTLSAIWADLFSTSSMVIRYTIKPPPQLESDPDLPQEVNYMRNLCNGYADKLEIGIDWDASFLYKRLMIQQQTHEQPAPSIVDKGVPLDVVLGPLVNEVVEPKRDDYVDENGDIVLDDSSNDVLPPKQIASQLTLEKVMELCRINESGSVGFFIPDAFITKSVTYYDLGKLFGKQWLNAEIIDAIICSIQKECTIHPDTRKPFLYVPVLEAQAIFEEVCESRNYKKRIQRVIACIGQLVTGIPIVIPIHLNNNHWCTIFVEPEHNTICSYDPYHNTDPVYGVLSYEIQVIRNLIKNTLPQNSDDWVYKPDVPRYIQFPELGAQQDSHSCGVFACLSVDLWSKTPNFDQESVSQLSKSYRSLQDESAKDIGEKKLKEFFFKRVVSFMDKSPAFFYLDQ